MTADRERMQQVIWNLLTNAIKFTGSGGRVVLTTSRLHDEIEIACRDTGIGIQLEFLPFVFDRFRQAESGTTRTQTGLGLGLAIVRHLVESHGGTVWAESGGHGAGTTVRVRLPAASKLTALPLRPDEPLSATHHAISAAGPFEEPLGRRVLVLDDDEDARELMAVALRHAGADVALAGSAREALGVLDDVRPDVIISDIGMPGEDGYMFLRTLEASGNGRFHDVPVIAVTAYARESDRANALKAGFRTHLAKPVDLDALVRIVRQVTSSPRPRPHDPD